jgi:glycerol-3-phosphate acyltransferase PlsY
MAAVVGYLLGSIPTGMIVARVYRNVDLTAYGSGRTGATNVLRTLGTGAAAIAFAGDFLKGLLAVLMVTWIVGLDNPRLPWFELITAIASVLGHSYSMFIGFKGGRGVVTGFGATIYAQPWLMFSTQVAGAIAIAVSRYVSLGSIVGTSVAGVLLCGLAVMTGEPAWALWGVLVAGFIVVAHRDNIERLLAGTERKLGERAL